MNTETITIEKNIWNDSITIREYQNGYESLLEISAQNISRHRKPGEPIEIHYRLLRYPGDTLAYWVGDLLKYISKKALRQGENALKHLLDVEIPALITHGYKHPAFPQMLNECLRYELPKHYKTDFTYHDVLHLGYSKPDRFVWILRECGTWLFVGSDRFTDAVLKQSEPSDIFYIYDDEKLIQVDKATASLFLQEITKKG